MRSNKMDYARLFLGMLLMGIAMGGFLELCGRAIAYEAYNNLSGAEELSLCVSDLMSNEIWTYREAYQACQEEANR